MPFNMTRPGDRVEVEINDKKTGESFFITIGTIPMSIGEKIEDCQVRALKILRAKLADSSSSDDQLLEGLKAQKEAFQLLIAYGVKGHRGLTGSDNSEIPCELTKDSEGIERLSEETLEVYYMNDSFIGLLTEFISKMKKVGIARYKIHGADILNGPTGEGESEPIPFTDSLRELLNDSTQSAAENMTA